MPKLNELSTRVLDAGIANWAGEKARRNEMDRQKEAVKDKLDEAQLALANMEGHKELQFHEDAKAVATLIYEAYKRAYTMVDGKKRS